MAAGLPSMRVFPLRAYRVCSYYLYCGIGLPSKFAIQLASRVNRLCEQKFVYLGLTGHLLGSWKGGDALLKGGAKCVVPSGVTPVNN